MNIVVFAWRDWQKQWKSSVQISGDPAEIQTEHLPNTSMERDRHINLAGDKYLKLLPFPYWVDVYTCVINWKICCFRFCISVALYSLLQAENYLKNAVFWDVATCRSCVNRRFEGTLIHTRSTRRHIPEDGILHSHRRENLKSYIETYLLAEIINTTIITLLRNMNYSIYVSK
jgi:hypothetical protein